MFIIITTKAYYLMFIISCYVYYHIMTYLLLRLRLRGGGLLPEQPVCEGPGRGAGHLHALRQDTIVNYNILY